MRITEAILISTGDHVVDAGHHGRLELHRVIGLVCKKIVFDREVKNTTNLLSLFEIRPSWREKKAGEKNHDLGALKDALIHGILENLPPSGGNKGRDLNCSAKRECMC